MVSSGYVLVAGIYIQFSDEIVFQVFSDPHTISRVQTIKGMAFIAVTALALFMTTALGYRRYSDKVTRADDLEVFGKDVVKGAPIMAVITDTLGRVQSVNQSTLDETGYAENEVLGSPVLSFIPHDHVAEVSASLEDNLDGQKTITRTPVMTKSGKTVKTEWSGAPIHNAHGNVVGTIHFGRNIRVEANYERLMRGEGNIGLILIEQTIAALAALVEKRDPYTARHQANVALLAVAIGKEMNLDEDSLTGLRFAALCHDVGKIQVPMEILNKPGQLSTAEFEVIKHHANAGYDILKQIDFPWPVADIVRQHHERMDGSGYPLGLKGNEIRIEARIIALADAAESIVAHRPYRAGRGMQKALSILLENRGTKFDVQVVDAFMRLYGRQETGLDVSDILGERSVQ